MTERGEETEGRREEKRREEKRREEEREIFHFSAKYSIFFSCSLLSRRRSSSFHCNCYYDRPCQETPHGYISSQSDGLPPLKESEARKRRWLWRPLSWSRVGD
jgi:hypothetical protein